MSPSSPSAAADEHSPTRADDGPPDPHAGRKSFDPATRPYRLFVYGVYWAFMLTFMVLCLVGIVRGVFFTEHDAPPAATASPTPGQAAEPSTSP